MASLLPSIAELSNGRLLSSALRLETPPPRRSSASVRVLPPCLMSAEVGGGNGGSPPGPRRDLEERFAVLNAGKWECRSCSFVYDQNEGDPSYPVAVGTDFQRLPEDWRCPTCGAVKSSFISKSFQLAGFAQNQKFGFGTNSLTSGQKSLLIYGSLLFFFLLFLSGYFIE